jgi:pyruvate dehydrogenase E1 component alpha subunit
MTYRITGHSRRDPCTYQPKEEREEWLQKEPIGIFSKRLLRREDITETDLEKINNTIEQELTEAVELAQREPEPRIEDLTADVFV